MTGASEEIGWHLAHELAAHGFDLVLVARSREALETLADELSDRFGVRALVRATDLVSPGALTATTRNRSRGLLDGREGSSLIYLSYEALMQLTRYSDYSLRVLIYLAVRPHELATVEEISKAYGISRAHLMKVVNHLGRAGLLSTVRGRGGGLSLARPPEEIGVGDVIRQTEDRLDLVECFDPATSHCRIEAVCGLRGVLEEALDAFLEALDRYTLADLVVRRRKPLDRLLGVS